MHRPRGHVKRRSTFPGVRLVTIVIDALPSGIITLKLRKRATYRYSFVVRTIAMPVATVASHTGNEAITLLGSKTRQYRATPTVNRAKSHQPSTPAWAPSIFLPVFEVHGLVAGNTRGRLILSRTLPRHFSHEKLMNRIAAPDEAILKWGPRSFHRVSQETE